MEIATIGTGLYTVSSSRPLPLYFLSIPSMSPRRRQTFPISAAAATTSTTTTATTQMHNSKTTRERRHSKPYLERRDAIFQFKQSTDLDSALQRFCAIAQGIFQMIISRYISEPEKKELLLQLLNWMTWQGYVVDPTTRNLILKNSHLFGRQLIAEILSKQHVMSRTKRS